MSNTTSYEDIINMYGVTNQHWIKKLLDETLTELNLEHYRNNEKLLHVFEQILSRIIGITAGSPIGTLISFQLSEKLSQDALDSTHIIMDKNDQVDQPNEEYFYRNNATDKLIQSEFEKSTNFSGLLNSRKSKHYNFIHMILKETENMSEFEKDIFTQLTWHQVEPNIYTMPLKKTHLAISLAKEVKFVTQPYEFPNQLCTFISCKNLYNYFAKRNNVETLIPLFHLLAVVASKKCQPIPISRHGLQSVGIDYLSRSSFENVLGNFEVGAIDQQNVNSDKRVSSMFLSQKLAVGTNYFDLISVLDDDEKK